MTRLRTDEPPAFHFETRQRAGWYGDDFGLKVPAALDRFGDLADKFCSRVGIQRWQWFKLNFHVLHRLDGAEFDAELGHSVELANHVFESGLVKIVAADGAHVVRSAENATGEKEEVRAKLRGARVEVGVRPPLAPP